MADEAFCEMCGDTGGALSMMVCENSDLGCLGGMHLYCCLPLRTEAPTEAWYCSQCSAAQQQAAKQQQAQRLAQKRKRQEQQQQRRRQRHLERQEKQRQQLGEEAKRRQKQERLGAEAPSAQPQGGTQEEGKGAGVEQAAQEGAAQRQQMLADQAGANSAAAAPTAAAADAAEAALEAATAKLEDALARAEAAAAAAAPAAGGQPGRMSQLRRSGLAAAIAAMGSGRGPAPAQPAGGRPSGPPGSTGPQQAQRAQQAQQTPGPSSACKDTLSTLFATLDRQDEASREQRRRVSSLLDGTSRLMQLHVRERAGRQQALQRQLSLAACRGTRLHWRGRLQLPLPQQADTWGAKLLCYGLPGNPHSGDAARWLVPLADAAAEERQPVPQLVHMEELGIAHEQAYLGASLLLVHDEAEPAHQAAQRQHWLALWLALSSNNQAVVIPVPPGAATTAAAAAARGSGGLQGGQLEGLFLALVPNKYDPDSRTLLGLLAVPHQAAQPPKKAVPARSILRRARSAGAAPAAGAAGPAAAAAAAAGQPVSSIWLERPAAKAAADGAGVGWADGGREDALPPAAAEQLELHEGPHYATPHRRAQQAARPPRLPAIRSFDASPAGRLASPPGVLPLEGMHIALVGFTVGAGWMPTFLKDLRDLGAVVYTSKVVLADVLVLHPAALQGGLDYHYAGTFPLGLAHLLATLPVRAYIDGSLQVPIDMVRKKRRLHGEEWQRPTLAFPGGLLVLLDAAALCSMPTATLSEVLSHVQRLQASCQDASWMWGAAAAPGDLATLQAAAEQGHAPAADNWQLWQSSSTARELAPGELSSSAGQGSVPPVVDHASKAARVHAFCCRLVFLCSSQPDTLRCAEGRVSILSGSPQDLLELLREQE